MFVADGDWKELGTAAEKDAVKKFAWVHVVVVATLFRKVNDQVEKAMRYRKNVV